METQNETKAKEIAKKLSHPNIDSLGDGDDEFDTRFYHVCKDAALQAMGWKERQLIDKLEDWLANHICNAYNFRGDDISATFIDDCLKAMKGE